MTNNVAIVRAYVRRHIFSRSFHSRNDHTELTYDKYKCTQKHASFNCNLKLTINLNTFACIPGNFLKNFQNSHPYPLTIFKIFLRVSFLHQGRLRGVELKDTVLAHPVIANTPGA